MDDSFFNYNVVEHNFFADIFMLLKPSNDEENCWLLISASIAITAGRVRDDPRKDAGQ